MCGGDCVWRHNALCLYFDVLADSACLGRDWVGRGCVSSSQRQRADEVESTAEHSDWTPSRPEKERKNSPCEQADKTCSRVRVRVGLAFSRFEALKERQGGAKQSWATL